MATSAQLQTASLAPGDTMPEVIEGYWSSKQVLLDCRQNIQPVQNTQQELEVLPVH